MELVTKDIYNEYDSLYLKEDMNYYCSELLEELNLPLVTFELDYSLSHSQGDGVKFVKFNISLDELLKYLLDIKELSQTKYNILKSASDEGLYELQCDIYGWNKVNISPYINDIKQGRKTYSLLESYYFYDDKYFVVGFGYDWEALSNILDDNEIESYIKNILDDLSDDLQKYGYELIRSEDEYQCKNILFNSWCELNNIETNIEFYEGGEYIKTKQELLESNIPIETYTRINDNNLDYYYISNDIINSIQEKERVVKYNSLTI